MSSSVPNFGIGTFKLRGNQCSAAISSALSIGYRSIDTARIYGNEISVGESIKISNILRSDIFITTKIAPDEQGKEKSFQSVISSLENLQISYIDLVSIHWPGASKRPPSSSENRYLRHGTWRGLLKARSLGLVKYIGVSNFTVNHLEQLEEEFGSDGVPYVNQFELHPYCQQSSILQHCRSRGIICQAYSSFGGSSGQDLVSDPVLGSIAHAHNCTTRAVLLVWALQLGIAVIPKASSPERLQANWDSYCAFINGDLVLSDEEMLHIAALDKSYHYCWNPNLVA